MKYSKLCCFFYTHVIFLLCLYFDTALASSASTNNKKLGGGGDVTNKANLETLKLIQVIIRHGDRAPIHPYPTDMYRNQSLYWPEGWTELTKLGLKQQLELGQYLRKRYDGFLPNKYSHFDFVALSSDEDRAIQSAEANLAGLYKLQDKKFDLTNPSGEIGWQAVPIHTIPQATDIWIDDKSICPRYIELLDQFYSSSTNFNQLNKEYAEFIQFISEKSGITGITTVNELFQVQDALRCEHFHNLTLPDWATDEVRNKLDYLKALSFKWKLETREMKRLRAGSMVGKLLQNFKTRSEIPDGFVPDDSPFQDERGFRKMHFISGHDSTLAGVLSVWDIFDTHIPPYATALMMELHKKPEDLEPNVQIYYRNETARVPYSLLIPACGSPCFLSKLEEISTEFIPYDWDQECQSLQAASPLLQKTLESTISATVQPLGLSTQGLLGMTGAVGIVATLLGSALVLNAYLKRGRATFANPQMGVNRYETFA